MATKQITTLFLDIGGVLLTNGWDHNIRARAAEKFSLDYAEMNERHHLTFDTYEEGKLSLDEYLKRVVFYQPRDFTPDVFKAFMYAQSKPFLEMIELMRGLRLNTVFRSQPSAMKDANSLRIASSNSNLAHS